MKVLVKMIARFLSLVRPSEDNIVELEMRKIVNNEEARYLNRLIGKN